MTDFKVPLLLCLIPLLFVFQLNAKGMELHFMGDVNFTSVIKFMDTELGGLSGVFYNQDTKRLLVISDDRSKLSPARFYEFSLDLRRNHFSVTPENTIFLKRKKGKKFKKNTIDAEDIIILPGGNLLISSEGNSKKKKFRPYLYEFTQGGELLGQWDVPERFKHLKKSGIRENNGFEALTITGDGKYVFVGNEESLIQDGPVASFEKGSLTRILLFEKKSKMYKQISEFAYPLDVIFNPTSLKKSKFATSGLVAMIALDDKTLITMERSFVRETRKNEIKLFLTKIDTNSTNLIDSNSIDLETIIPLEKKLLLNLDDVLPEMNPNYRLLDNIEGLCFGPVLSNGNSSLILVSDNNFNTFQRTLFMAFEFKK